MTPKPKVKRSRSSGIRTVFEKMSLALKTAQEELKECSKSVTPSELGKLFVTISNSHDGLYVSAVSHGKNFEIKGGWEITFPKLAEEIYKNLISHDDADKVVAGLRMMATFIENESLADR